MTDLATYTLDGTVATIQMDDGKVNVVSPAMIQSIGAALDRARADQAAVVLTGRSGTFSAGFDRNVLLGGGSAALDMLVGGFKLAERLLSFPRPVVIACSGHALAMGAFLALTGDYRIGVRGAFKVGANEVAIGLTMPRFATELCKLRLSTTYLQRSVLNAEIYDPETAISAGFLDRVVAAEELPPVAQRIAADLAKLPARSFAFTKQRLREDALVRLRKAIDEDGADFGALTAT
jgi:enoyl-CoA hydratase